MSVMQNFKLCHSKISEAGRAGKHTCDYKLEGSFVCIHILCIGETAASIASKLHGIILAVGCPSAAPVD